MGRNPIYHLLEARRPEWGDVDGMPLALRFQSDEHERQAVRTLALCDVSSLPKIGVKGPDADHWLASRGIDVPPALFDAQRLPDGGVIARVGGDDFLLESGPTGETVAAIAAALDVATGRIVHIDRQEAAFLLAGSRALEVLLQTCGINFAEAVAGRLVMTRVAAVSCGVLPEVADDLPLFRIWVDCSYAVYLWETLAAICEELGGSIVGAACLGFRPE
ncbi:MAG: hypothetical protein WD648_00175 [Planctomycetaceae bacterium]